jgi:hypothetical protein
MKFIFLTLCIFLFLGKTNAQSQSSSPTRYTNNGGDDSFGVTNIGSSDDTYECVNLNLNDKAIGTFDKFEFNIPLNATITNITITIEGYWNLENARGSFEIDLDNGLNNEYNLVKDKTAISTTDLTLTYSDVPSVGEIFGLDISTEITPTIINSDDFGIEIEEIKSKKNGGQFCFDYINITIDYIVSLPVEMLYFRFNLVDDYTKLSWATASEINSHYFAIERSFDGIKFDSLNFVKSVGNSIIVNKYMFIDYRKHTEKNVYYRLKQVDFDSTFCYSNIILLTNDLTHLNVYYKDGYIIVESDENNHNIIVTKLDGSIVDINQKTPKGIYFIRVYNSNIEKVFKIIAR